MKRRSFIKDSTIAVFGITAFGSISWNGKEFVADSPTTTDILGPFYRPGSPMRTNLVPPGSTGNVLHLTGIVYDDTGKKPQPNVLIEIWHCDGKMQYDNVSEEYRYRGAVKTGDDGSYAFITHMPIPYKDGDDWRTAHIHMRVSSAGYQDLITQIYFKGDPYLKTDDAAKHPLSSTRIMNISKNAYGESQVAFNVIMGRTYQLDESGYKKITGIYQLKNGNAEFTREDDLLILKLNGQIWEALAYKGNNTFEGGLKFNKAKFEILPNGDVKTYITMWDMPGNLRFLENLEGIKILNYSN
jgi:protocatechuate 3,4-dioxygenase beta subunit